MYNNLVEKCFTDCVDSFRRRDLDGTEEKVRSLLNKQALLNSLSELPRALGHTEPVFSMASQQPQALALHLP